MNSNQPASRAHGAQGPAPAYGAQQAGTRNTRVYKVYWGVLFGVTILTWIFAVAASAHGGLLMAGSSSALGFQDDCDLLFYGVDDSSICKTFDAAKAFQYLAAILISLILVLVLVAAFMSAPRTEKFGLVTGVSLAVYAVFQLIAFALMLAFANKVPLDLTAGPTAGLAIVAWIFGTVEAAVTLIYFKRATTDQDGPFRRCMPSGAGTTAGGNATAAV
ncbi:unnamed protein product [Pylaiella littoralis]